MPIYEFRCQACGETFETLVRSSSEEVRCAACGGGDVKRLMSMFASKSGDTFTPSSGGSSCSGCTSSSCSGCH